MKFSVYALFDVCNPSIIKYIGQTQNLNVRFNRHRSGKDSTTGEWVRSVVASGSTIGVKLLAESDELNATNVEQRMIAQHDSPHLINIRRNEVKPFEFKVSPIVSLKEMELRYINYALEMFNGNKVTTAKALGIGRQTLYNKLGIDCNE